MLLVALAIVVSTAAGVAAERRHGERTERLTARMMDAIVWVVLPPVAFLVVARLELDSGVGVGLLLGYAVLALVGFAAYAAATRWLDLPPPSAGSLVLVVVLANTGFLGIPLCATLLGEDAIGPAVAWDTAVSAVVLVTAGYGVGAALGTRAGDTARARTRAYLTRNPVLAAAVLGLLAPDALAPRALVDTAELAVMGLLPVGFFVLGVHLTGAAGLRPGVPIVVALGLRLIAAPALLLGLSAALVELPDAYLVQAAMPSGINSLLVAHVYGLDLRLAAAGVAWSTAVVVPVAVVAGLA